MEAATVTVLPAPGRDPIDRLRDFLTGCADGLVQFPGLTTTAFPGLIRMDNSKTFCGRYRKEMIEKVGQVIFEAQGDGAGRDGATLYSVATALGVLSCIMFPFLISSTLREAAAGLRVCPPAATAG
jgi:hypothetical protein